jgi:hypothetical protein
VGPTYLWPFSEYLLPDWDFKNICFEPEDNRVKIYVTKCMCVTKCVRDKVYLKECVTKSRATRCRATRCRVTVCVCV